MDVVLGIAVVLFAVGAFAGTLLIFPAMREGFRGQWARFPPEARRRGVVAGAFTAIYIAVGAALVITAPWGPRSVLYVVGVGGGGLMLIAFLGVLVQAITDTRRVRRR